jgi:hypothetical protein
MKFDYIVGNPPYQKPQEHDGKRGGGETLWDEFVKVAINSMVVDNGFICMIHPCGWRAPKGSYHEVKDAMMANQLHYLEIHNSGDGLKTFGAATRYDWYVMQKSAPKKNTDILDEEGVSWNIDLKTLPFIPNGKIDKVMELIAGVGEEKVDVLYSRSEYGSDKDWISKTKTPTHIYPVIHSIKKAGLNLLWSSKKGTMIGVPKVVFGCGQSDTFVDYKGEYGMSQHARAIVADPKDLENINKAMNNPEFLEISSACTLVSTGMFVDKYNKDVLQLFKKDFWKEFV